MTLGRYRRFREEAILAWVEAREARELRRGQKRVATNRIDELQVMGLNCNGRGLAITATAGDYRGVVTANIG